MQIKHVDGTDVDFIKLTNLLDDEYVERFGDLALKYRQHNTLKDIRDVFVAYDNHKAIACGGFKNYSNDTAEVKRIFVIKDYRRRHIASEIIKYCEAEAKQQGFRYMVLVTGVEMPEAISLYNGIGYNFIKNYDHFEGDKVCVCMKKIL